MMFPFTILKILLIFFIARAFSKIIQNDCAHLAYSDICVQFGDKMYLINGNARLNWFEAERFCRRQNGFLANIENQNQLNAISNYLVSNGYLNGEHRFWIGGNDLGSNRTFYSIGTGDIIPFTKWSPGEPNNSYENCLFLWKHQNDFLMNDAECKNKEHFICDI